MGLVSVDGLSQSGSEEVDNVAGKSGPGGTIFAAFEEVDRLFGGKLLEPKLRDAALPEFVGFEFGMFGKHQGLELVAVEHSEYPAAGNVAFLDGSDSEVFANFEFFGLVCHGLFLWLKVFYGLLVRSNTDTLSHDVWNASSELSIDYPGF